MKTFTTLTIQVILLAVLILSQSCKKKSDDTPATGPVPVLLTVSYSNVLISTADFTGNVTSDGGNYVTKRGFCWSKSNQNPTIQNDTVVCGSGAGLFTGTIKRLQGQSLYYVRTYATNTNGTGYGSTFNLTTIDTTITDVENNHYHIIQIGTQVWMAENLKVTSTRSGFPIPNVTDATQWGQLGQYQTGAYCDYQNDPTNSVTYGRLYNWYAVQNLNISPAGYHIPSYDEWYQLINYFGGDNFAAAKLKEAGPLHWGSDNTGATNESGFTALPGGWRTVQSAFSEISYSGSWWTSLYYMSDEAWMIRMTSDQNSIYSNRFPVTFGLSIRCVRD